MNIEKYGMKKCDSCQKLHPIEHSCCIPTVKPNYMASGDIVVRFTKLRKGGKYKKHGK